MICSKDLTDLKNGDKLAFEKIFELYYRSLVVFAQKYVIKIELAEDLVQEVFVKFWEKRNSIKDVETLKAFLYISVRNKSLNELRHQKNVEKYEREMIAIKSEESFFSNHLIEEETSRLVFQAVNKLPEQTRVVFNMSLSGIKNAQISEELNLSISTVKYHKMKAVLSLRQQLKTSFYVLAAYIQLFDL
ncbi:RNA polymerase sigma-70 factor [Labilibaculum sp.]|uniref:RNA polymerase sigma-70 factor n=1 Tax=Labilibaculum sp. TaxID=2060723 RepID=UPI003566E658